MIRTEYEIGDMVYAAADILNDGGMPGIEEPEGLIAPSGARGVIVNTGVAELDKSQAIYLVQFESGPEKPWATRSAACPKT